MSLTDICVQQLEVKSVNMEDTILIAIPVRDREEQLVNLLMDIEELNYNKRLIELFFYVNDSSSVVKSMLEGFTLSRNGVFRKIITVEKDFGNISDTRILINREDIYRTLAYIRNEMLDYFKRSDNRYLFMVDSDTRLNVKFMNRMVSLLKEDSDKHLIFPKLTVDYDQGMLWNVMEYTGRGIFHKVKFSEEGIFKVDVLGGGVIFCDREVAEKDIRFAFHRQGEFVGFSLDCREKGLDLWCIQEKGLAYHEMV